MKKEQACMVCMHGIANRQCVRCKRFMCVDCEGTQGFCLQCEHMND